MLDFETLYRKYVDAMVIYAKKYIPVHDAQDVVADVFCIAYGKMNKFPTEERFRMFCYVSIRNRCFDFLKHQKIMVKKEDDISHSLGQDSNLIFLAEVEADLINMIKERMERLSDTEKAVIVLTYMEGLSNQDICAKLNLKYQLLRNTQTLALKKLRLDYFNKSNYPGRPSNDSVRRFLDKYGHQ